MKNKIIILILILLPKIVFGNDLEINDLEIKINKTTINGSILQENLEKIVNKIYKNDLEKKEIIYKKLSVEIDKINKNGDKNLGNIKKIIDYSLEKTTKELDIYYNKVRKITLGYTKTGLPIYAYFSGNPNAGYFGIFANIHGGYEYGTYETAIYLIKEFQNTGVTGWFIIPTINPEGLEYYKKYSTKYDAYILGRVNSNNIDLNRNFCTDNFELKTYIKNGEYIDTGTNLCNSENETKIVIDTLNKYKFNKIISLHSEGDILFIPDNSINDQKIINFGNEISNILPTYKFDLDYKNDYTKEQKITEYEINEGGNAEYTGTMETYIYEKYKIPTILIEIDKHGKVEYGLKGIIDYLIKK